MARRGNCWDNASQESFFCHMKDELHLKECLDFEEVKKKIDVHMNHYNDYKYQQDLNKMIRVEYRIYLLEVGQPLLNKIIKVENTTIQSAPL